MLTKKGALNMEDRKLFRGALNGFNKHDVTHYISTLSERNQLEIEELKGKFSELEGKLEMLNKEKQKLEQALRLSNDEKDNLSKQCEIYLNKSHLYEELQQNIGQIMIETKKTADSMIEEAINVSNMIKENAQTEMLELHKKSIELKKNIPEVASKLNSELDSIKEKITFFLNYYEKAMKYLQMPNVDSKNVEQPISQVIVPTVDKREIKEQDKKWRFFK